MDIDVLAAGHMKFSAYIDDQRNGPFLAANTLQLLLQSNHATTGYLSYQCARSSLILTELSRPTSSGARFHRRSSTGFKTIYSAPILIWSSPGCVARLRHKIL